MDKQKIRQISKIIKDNKKFIVTTHVVPDGDGLGSGLALDRFLQNIGKKSTIVNPHSTPRKFSFVDQNNRIKAYPQKKNERSRWKLPDVDVIFVLDTNDWQRLGALGKLLKNSSAIKVFIDHHMVETQYDGCFFWIEEGASSTGEMIYQLVENMKGKIDKIIALAIYVSILTDTSSFKYSRTTALSHRIAAKLLDMGLVPEHIYTRIYSSNSLDKMYFLGHVLSEIQLICGGKVAWVAIPKKLRTLYHATIEDTQGFINHLLLIKSVEIALLFREEKKNQIKISIRSKGNIPIHSFASKLGGGGHRFAAGVHFRGTMHDVMNKVLTNIRNIFSNLEEKYL